MDTDPKADISALTIAVEKQTSPEISEDLRNAINTLMDQPKNVRRSLIQSVSELLPSISSGYGAGCLAVWFGALVENGRDATLSFEAVRKTWLRWARLIQVDEQDKVSTAPEPAFYAVDDCARSLVSHCSKDESLRRRLIDDETFASEVSRLAADSTGAMWLEQLIKQASGELIILNMERCTGSLVRYQHLSNCFHLFTLIQGTLSHWLPLSKRPAKAVIDSAKEPNSTRIRDEALWHYQQPISDAPDLGLSVWGEGHPHEILSIDNQQVLVLWPMILKGRGWDSGFFEPLLTQRPPLLEIVRDLSPDEFALWRSKLKPSEKREPIPLPPKVEETPSPWWQFWRR